MARTTVAELETRINGMEANLDKLVNLVSALAAQPVKQTAKPEPKAKPFVAECPDYATAAQRIEYDKLAERARKQRKAMVEAMGTESVSAFIPVPKTADRMPHSIKWTATYSK